MSSAILAIETSTPLGSVAVWRDGAVCFEQSFSSARSHNSQLFEPLREALTTCGDGLSAIVVGTGPASYTGVRIGIAAAQGIALSRGVPGIGLASVLAVDGQTRGRYRVCGDARRGTFFLAAVDGSTASAEISTMDAEELRRLHGEMSGGTDWLTFDSQAPLALDKVRCTAPSASALARVAGSLSANDLAERAKLLLEPIYLAAPFITMPGKRSGAGE